MSTVRTLLISQKPELPAHVDRAFAAGGLDVELVVVDAVQTALDTLQEQEFGLLLLDLETPDAEGLDGVEQLAMTHPVPILALHEEAPVALSGPTVKAGAEALLSTASLRSGLDLPRTARAAIERHQRSLRTARSDRLAVVGRMAASVAHEINNPVAFVTLNHSAAQRSVRELAGLLHNGSEREQELLADLRHLLTENQEGLERIRTLVRDLRLFVREEERIFEELRLDALVERSIKLIRNEIRHHATLELDLPQVAPIIGEAHRIAQVVTNLLINAAQATETGTGPARIRAKLSEDPSAVMLTVEDSGRGVPQNLQDRIFDPFFTTKGEEVGTGLGLSLCAEIVKQHNGQIRVDDSPGLGGARFTVSLPIDTKLRVSRPSVGPLVLGLQGRARVLLVDDERSLLRAYKRILSAEHDVTAVESATEALGVIEKDRAFDIIICDLMMPDVDGAQFFERLGGIDASLQDRVVFCTGGAVTPRAQRVVQNYPERIYEKPLSPTLLQQLVRESLRGPVDRAVDVPS